MILCHVSLKLPGSCRTPSRSGSESGHVKYLTLYSPSCTRIQPRFISSSVRRVRPSTYMPNTPVYLCMPYASLSFATLALFPHKTPHVRQRTTRPRNTRKIGPTMARTQPYTTHSRISTKSRKSGNTLARRILGPIDSGSKGAVWFTKRVYASATSVASSAEIAPPELSESTDDVTSSERSTSLLPYIQQERARCARIAYRSRCSASRVSVSSKLGGIEYTRSSVYLSSRYMKVNAMHAMGSRIGMPPA
mmetsp:Transcript_2274/g.7602  ORF Transcript_2274/g.7602 Transcript_2274/m.7602 type:complete len:249 (-) Transcript_2274:2451-3197(-)